MGSDILGGPYSRHTPMSTEALPESVVSGQVGEMRFKSTSSVWDGPQVIRFHCSSYYFK